MKQSNFTKTMNNLNKFFFNTMLKGEEVFTGKNEDSDTCCYLSDSHFVAKMFNCNILSTVKCKSFNIDEMFEKETDRTLEPLTIDCVLPKNSKNNFDLVKLTYKDGKSVYIQQKFFKLFEKADFFGDGELHHPVTACVDGSNIGMILPVNYKN